MNIVILAGGFGERLWPASGSNFPKQFMRFCGGLSFFQQALRRAALLNCRDIKNFQNVKSADNADIQNRKEAETGDSLIAVITRKAIFQQTVRQCADFAQTLSADMRRRFLDQLTVIAEPASRHTTAPLALACRYIQALYKQNDIKERALLSLTADHVIEPFEAFAADVQTAEKQAQSGRFVCFAISPTEASTGFGYIKTGECIETGVHTIDAFKEKPDAQTAQRYIKSGLYFWNSGMFCFLPSVFMNELNLHVPEIAKHFPECDFLQPDIRETDGIKTVQSWPYMEDAYKDVPAIAADIAIAERTDKACAVNASFDWRDIGTWESFAELFDELKYSASVTDGSTKTAHSADDTKKANFIEADSSGCFVYSDIPAVLCGVKDIIAVVKNGKLFIAKKGSSSLLKDKTVRGFIEGLDLE
ncbi:mannose-1-phosphate guanylyltransferase [Treponema sp. OMZ 840]|uniref:sugar phosphate nucleotidyltransferase n=1 Tax=Treponema sp. OMZ 840 TaxID=244313 RepID=UPI003D8F7E01